MQINPVLSLSLSVQSFAAGPWGLAVPPMTPVLPVPSWGWPLPGGATAKLWTLAGARGVPKCPQITWDSGGSTAEVWAGYPLLLITSRFRQLLAAEPSAVPL